MMLGKTPKVRFGSLTQEDEDLVDSTSEGDTTDLPVEYPTTPRPKTRSHPITRSQSKTGKGHKRSLCQFRWKPLR